MIFTLYRLNADHALRRFFGDNMNRDQLKEKAHSLPLSPGVYIMRDKENRVIYVGKAKKLKNRVSQYFQDSVTHSAKTRLMVSKIDHFDVIVASSEFEALVLECSLIKRNQPRYNILLKDDKGYPYLRLNMKAPYPTISMVSRISDDGAEYFGPFGSRHVTQNVLQTIQNTLKLPTCGKRFPRDIGKGRPCLNYHMNQCSGWCQECRSQQEYMAVIEQARDLLMGKYKDVLSRIRGEMLQAAESLNFELAATLRDRLNAVEALGKKQLVTAGSMSDTDVIGFAQTEAKACFVVLHFRDGNLLDKDYEVLTLQDDAVVAVSALVKQYYLAKGFAPRNIYLPFHIEDSALFSQLMEQKLNCRSRFIVPQRGDKARLVELAQKNAMEEALRITDKEERLSGTLHLLAKMLGTETPRRMESFDISNIAGTDIVASMVVFVDGKPRKSEYKKFKINGLSDQDDYGSMRQVLTRRFNHYAAGDKGFDQLPDLLLIDGGVEHARIACAVLQEFDLSINTFGMVKDDRHRTRALVTPDGLEIAIDAQPSVFSLIGQIQEETHRFAITYHRKLRSNRLQYSELDRIPGIGPKRKQDLLNTFKSLKNIRQTSLSDLKRILPTDAAHAVYQHFHTEVQE